MPVVFLVVFLDIVGFSIIIPIFVYYAMELGASRELATAMLSIYPLAMLLATPILGRLSDLYGRKPIMLASLFGAILGYLMLGFAASLWVVALARAPSSTCHRLLAAASIHLPAPLTRHRKQPWHLSRVRWRMSSANVACG